VHQTEEAIREPGGVGAVLLNAQVGLVIKEAVPNIGGILDADVDHLRAEGRILVGEVRVEHPAGIGAILGIDVSGALGTAAGFEPLAARRGGRAISPASGERMPELGVDESGKSGRVSVIADVPCLGPGRCRVGDAGTGGGHFHPPEIDGTGQNGGQEQRFMFDWLSGFQVDEMPGEARPCVDLQQQFRDFDMRQQGNRPVNQILGGGRNERVQRGHFEFRLRDQRIGQIVA
jgi:hypothetical protein